MRTRHFPIRLLLLAIVAGILAPGSAMAEEKDKFETLVFLSPRGPFFLGLRLQVDNDEFRGWLTNYLFKKLDSDRDGFLEESQLDLIPAQLLTRLGYESNGKQLKVDIAAEDKKISKDRFVEFFSQKLSSSFLITEKEVAAVQAINVLPKFDANDDGFLSEKELQTGLDHLTQQDIDDDQTLSAAELLPFRDPNNPQTFVAPNTDDLPFLQIIGGGEQKLAKRLVDFYTKQNGELDTTAVRLKQRVFAKFDTDKSGGWSVEETAAFLKQPSHHVEMRIVFSTRRRAALLAKVINPSAAVEVKQTRADRVTLVLDSLPLKIRAEQSLRSGFSNNRGFCGQFFALSDKDRSKYLDEKEFPEFAGRASMATGNASFEAFDSDGDKMVTRNEMYQLLDRQTIASKSQLEVTVHSDGRSLFQMLDSNIDRRLSLREMREGFEKLAELDVDKDRRVSQVEASTPSEYSLRVGLGKTALMRSSMMSQMDRPGMQIDARLPAAGALKGPVWFQKMDRNRDGDISRREFLGPLKVFEKLDTDKDGLLSVSEAEAGKAN